MSIQLICQKCRSEAGVKARDRPDGTTEILCRSCRGEPEPIKKLEALKTPRDANIAKAIEILRERIIVNFPDETGEAWIQYLDEGKRRFAAVECTTFRDWVRVSLDCMTGAPRGSWVDEIVQLFAAEARRERPHQLHLRSANINGTWFFQLDEEQTLRIAEGELQIIPSLPIFRQFRHQAPLDVDLNASMEDLGRLTRYLRFADEWEAQLFLSTIPAYAVPGIARPAQLCRGPPGSGKSTLGRLTKLLMDPAIAFFKGTPFPKNEGDWFVLSRQHAFILLDNLGGLSREEQDEICRTVTGRTVEKRKLYTDGEVVSASIQAVVLLNAIDLGGLASDFLDRAIIWDLQRIPDEARVPEELFWQQLREDLPKIRGAIFQVLAKAQVLAKQVKAPEDFRLADFARYAAACAAARGENPDLFARNLSFKADLQKDEGLEQSRLTEPLLTFMESRDKWTGSPEELLRELTRQEFGVVIGEGVHERTEVRNVPREWFKTPRGLVGELKRLMHLWPRVGLRYTPSRQVAKGRRRLILEKISESTASSATQPPKPLNSWLPAPITGGGCFETDRNQPHPTATHRGAVAEGLRSQNPNRNPELPDEKLEEGAVVTEEIIEST